MDYDGLKVRLHSHCEDAWIDARRNGNALNGGMKQTTNKALIPPDLLVREFPTPEKAT